MSDPRLIVARLVDAGWRPYNGQPDKAVYERLDCPHYGAKSRAKRPLWFSKGDKFTCIGCRRACSMQRPEGFPAPLPLHYPDRGERFTLTPQEMVARRHSLRVPEAAYCLNVSERTIYRMIDDAILTVLEDRSPLRIKASDVAAEMERWEE